MKTGALLLAALILLNLFGGCAEAGFYQPLEFADMDFDNPASRWCWARSAVSDHFCLFWEPGFGDDPASEALPEDMRVDVDALLARAERFYHTNADRLGFLDAGAQSRLDALRMEIYLLYQPEWLATGSGYDNVIGALWVNPQACADEGATLAHEIGHCFQYQVYCDQLLNGIAEADGSGFRYAPGDGMGNAFWEQCAQWQAWQDYPEEAFNAIDMAGWFANCHRAFENEWMRYQSYWLPYAWTQTWGQDAVGRLWRESRWPEDALSACLRLFCGGDMDALNAMLYDYAARCATFDFDAVRELAGHWVGGYTTAYAQEDGWMQVAYAACPAPSGFTVTELRVEDAGRPVKVTFEGLPFGARLAETDPGEWHVGADGEKVGGAMQTYNLLPDGAGEVRPGWRYGFAALCADGSRVYGPMADADAGEVTFEPPEGAERLFFVVLGALDAPSPHVWDEDECTDIQIPYRLKVENAIAVNALAP